MALRCLLVDDSARFVKSAKELLEREGVEVHTASTGGQALRRADELRPDVVLLDIDLGAESGFEVARQLHDVSSQTSPGDPAIILISSYLEKDFEELIAASPVLGFVAKSSLSAGAIRELLEGGAKDPS